LHDANNTRNDVANGFSAGYHPIRLEVRWRAYGSFIGTYGSQAEVIARIEYSLDNGATPFTVLEQYTWTSQTPACPVPSNQSIRCSDHVVSVNLGTLQKTDQIKVRAFMQSRMTNCIPTCSAHPRSVTGVIQVADIRVVVDNCRIPLGETSTAVGWRPSPDSTIHDWEGTLEVPSGVSFQGQFVEEQDPGGGVDGCHWEESIWDPFNAVDGLRWGPVDANQKYRWDGIGYFEHIAQYYRDEGKAPCSTTIPQRMAIRCGGDGSTLYLPYDQHNIGAAITSSTVSSTRNGNTVPRTWP
jgi:hypothetical protein